MRDNTLKPELWQSRMESLESRLARFDAVYVDSSEPDHRRRNAGNVSLDLRFDLALARYSAGAPLAEVTAPLEVALRELLPQYLSSFPPDAECGMAVPAFDEVHRMLAGLVLTKAPASAFGPVFALIDASKKKMPNWGGWDEIWTAYGTAFGRPGQKADRPVHWPEAYAPLREAIESKNALRLAVFVKGWLPEMKSELAAQTGRAAGNGYVGEWCLEAAAAAVAFGIDDSAARALPTYPKDWADWARG